VAVREFIVAEWAPGQVEYWASLGAVSDVGKKDGAAGGGPDVFVGGVQFVDQSIAVRVGKEKGTKLPRGARVLSIGSAKKEVEEADG
jgi:hypothetical protein